MVIEARRPLLSRLEYISLENGEYKEVAILSFRDRKHVDRIIEHLISDELVAFHGWGVSGVCGRVDVDSKFQKFWEIKQGRPPGAKIPLLEPPEVAVGHIDWDSVHKDYCYLKDPRQFSKLWKSFLPCHLIFPYKRAGNSLSEAVVTQATPVPTICLFWNADPALEHLLSVLKQINNKVQLGVTSLNEPSEVPPYNTIELIEYLKERKITDYDYVVEDPIMEPFDIASSHSQFVAPLVGGEPSWKMIRKGSVSGELFSKYTNFPVMVEDNVKLAVRRHPYSVNLDIRIREAGKKIKKGLK